MMAVIVQGLAMLGLWVLAAVIYSFVTIGGAWLISQIYGDYFDSDYMLGMGWFIGLFLYVVTAAVVYLKLLPLIK